jgi:SpoVK/Ycf46/Vps4 family AAA+-type ATPase
VILYGPPGTGKTFWAERTARDLSAYDAFGMPFGELVAEQQMKVIGDSREQAGRVRFCCFHPAYGYEDFLEGYRPEETDGRMTFVLRCGIFKEKPIGTFPKFARIIHDDILPLLEEYCYEDFAMLERILGQGLVDGERQEIRHELFADDRHDDLVQALLAPCPEIAASPQALEAEIQEEDGSDEPDEEGDDE